MNEYNVYISGWNGDETMVIKASNEDEAINISLARAACPFAAVYEVEQV